MDPSTPDNNNTTTNDSSTAKETGTGQLSPEHINYLRARAVPVELAIQAGLRSVSAEEAGNLLRRKGPTASPGLAISYSDISPIQWRIRLDTPTDGARYLCEANREVPVYVPAALPGMICRRLSWKVRSRRWRSPPLGSELSGWAGRPPR